MDTLTLITIKGLAVAKENGLFDLPEKYNIPFDEEIVADFINVQINDLFEFATLEQFLSNENLFARAFMYTYGKGVEFALAHIVSKPLKKIGYNFDHCMQGNGLSNIPVNFLSEINSHKSILICMYNEMYGATRGSQERLINEGIRFSDCMTKVLNSAFYIGKRVALSLDINKNEIIDFSDNEVDIKYDYDNYNQNYSEDDFQIS